MCQDDEGCCKWMLAATLRSCFGPCFKRLGAPAGYDSIEDSPTLHHPDSLASHGRQLDNGYDTVGRTKHGLDYCNRSKSTSEIFRSDDFYYAPEFIRPDKRSFSASFGYLDENEMFETQSQGMRSTLTSTNDLRSDMSEAFWSCRGSVSRSSTGLDSDQDFYSDQSEEPHIQDTEQDTDSGCASTVAVQARTTASQKKIGVTGGKRRLPAVCQFQKVRSGSNSTETCYYSGGHSNFNSKLSAL